MSTSIMPTAEAIMDIAALQRGALEFAKANGLYFNPTIHGVPEDLLRQIAADHHVLVRESRTDQGPYLSVMVEDVVLFAHPIGVA